MNTVRLSVSTTAALLLAATAARAAEPAAGGKAAARGVEAKVMELTGAETRIVWLRHRQWESYRGSLDGGGGFSLMAFDTGGKGERELVPEGELYNPLISPSGRRVIYTAKTDGKLQIHGMDWSGENGRTLGDGFALWTWREPATGIEWVYAGSAGSKDGTFVERFQLDGPDTRERIYTGRVSNRFSLSADGSRAVGEFPHPETGMLYSRTGQLDRKNYRSGCNSYIAPDDSCLVTIMSGGHDLVTLYKPDGSFHDVRVIPPGLKPLKDGKSGCVWNPKWATDARHMVLAGPFKNLGPDRADIWLGQFADDFKSIAKWVQVTDNEHMDVYAFAWVDPGLGRYAGEAPYTLSVPPAVIGPGDWQWDFGDSTRGTDGTHTYAKAGTYTVTATRRARRLEGTVRVAPPVPPQVLFATPLDDRRVLLSCSEPVQVADGRVTLASGAAAMKLSLDSEGSGIIAEFPAPLAARETLTVTGVTDRAQVPNAVTPVETQVVTPDWPSNRAGLTYLWQNARTRNLILDARFGLPARTTVGTFSNHQLSVPARFNRSGAAVAEGGGFVLDPGSPQRIYGGITKTHQFSFEIVITPADLAQTKGDDDKPIAIADWGYGWRNGVFWLFQEKDRLAVGLSKKWGDREPEVFEMATLPDAKPHHVIVSLAAKRLAIHLDGKQVKEIDPSPASFIEVGPPPFQLAAHSPDAHKNVWRGTFEYLAMYDRFIEESEAAKNAAAVAAALAKRKALPRIELQATLVAKSRIPAPGQMAPYRNALVVNEYRVEKVLTGTYAPKTIRVAQWGVIDLQPTALVALQPGASVKLVLETFADHDELVSELISDTLEENFDLTLYTDVNL
jgi:hypothetical protein